MNCGRIIIVVTMAAVCMCIAPAQADIEARGYDMRIGADAEYGYSWRGIQKHEEFVFQPYYQIEIDNPNIELNLWSNINVSGKNDGEMTESHFSGDYSFGVADFWVTVGGVYYNYLTEIEYSDDVADTVDDTTEVYLQFEWLGGVGVTPLIAVYYDVDKAEGAYGQIGFKYAPDEYAEVEYGFKALLGFATEDWNEYYFGGDRDSSFVNFDFGVFTNWMIEDNVGAKLAADFSTLIDSDLQDAVDNNNTLTISLGIYLNF